MPHQSCTVRGCPNDVRADDHFICRAHWEQRCGQIDRAIGRASVIYIGRTADPERRRAAHRQAKGLEEFWIVHTASTADEAIAIEEALIKRYRRRLAPGLLDNITDTSDGGIREGRNHIYVAFTR